MGSIADKLSYLNDTKNALTANLRTKGLTVPDESTFREQVNMVLDIQFGGSSPTLQSKSVTPTGEQITVTPDSGYDGLREVTVEGDSNLVPANIKAGVSIYGKTGTFEGAGGGGGITTTKRISGVSISENNNTFILTLEDDSTISGSASFDSNGTPTDLSDNVGNSVQFSNGYPNSATDIEGNTVPISWG